MSIALPVSTKWLTSAIATSKRQPLARPTLAGSQYTASSKSRASSPSIVTSGISHRLTRCFLSCARTLSGKPLACARPAAENSCGTPYLRTAISISMPGSSTSPSTSVMRPTGWPNNAGGSGSSTTPTCPRFATPAPILAHDARAHAVLVQHCAHLVRRDIQVALAVVTDDEPVPVPVPLHAAFDLVRHMRGLRAGGHFLAVQS